MDLIYYSAPHCERRDTDDGCAAIAAIGIVRHECGCSLSRKEQGHSLRQEDQGRHRIGNYYDVHEIQMGFALRRN